MLTSYAGTITANLAGGASVTSATSWSATTLGYYIKALAGLNPNATFANGGVLAATSANLNLPYSVAVDSVGNVYIADTNNHKIRKIDSSGIMTTIAGTGTSGYLATQDGGAATSAQLNNPEGVAVDSAGNVYIGDYGNHRIRKVDSSGIISTFAGTGTAGYVATQDGGPATAARLNYPKALAVDSAGNVYIADSKNHRIRKINSSGIISSIAGTGILGYVATQDGGAATAAQLNFPRGVAVDSAGNVYIGDSNNNRVRKVDSSGIISTFAGTGTAGYVATQDGGPATAAQLNGPYELAVDSAGNVYIADTVNNRIRKVNSSGIITTFAGIAGNGGFSGDGGLATAALFNGILGVAVDSAGNVYIADSGNKRVRMVLGPGSPANNGNITTIAATITIADTVGYSGDGILATSSKLNNPYGVAVDSAGNVYIADTLNSLIRKITADGKINIFAGLGYDGYNNPISIIANSTPIFNPYGMALYSDGSLYFSDNRNYIIRKITADGKISNFAGTAEKSGFAGDGNPASFNAKFNSASGVAIDSAGNVYIGDTLNNRIRKIDSNSGLISTIAGTGVAGYAASQDGKAATSAKLNNPRGVAVDSAGNVYIGDSGNNMIRKVDSSGIITTIAGTGTAGFSGDGGAPTAAQLNGPFGVAVDSAGNVYIADYGNSRIRMIDRNTGLISTIAGTGTITGTFKDGDQATSANLNKPYDIAVDSAGNVYIADTWNYLIEMLY